GVWSPRTAKTAAHLFVMDAMRLSIRLWGILFHSSRSAISKSRTVAGGLGHAAMRRLSMSQTFSIGFRSGEHAGHSIRCIVSASSMFSTRRALCGRALSSWKTNESPMAPASVRPPMLIPPHTIQPALLCCDLSRTNAGLFRVPLSLHYKNTSGVTL
ncbi:hypothetical protein TNCV_4571901, partial [Trichonephila clavipes]